MSFVSSRGHYFSISDILTSQERVPCTFRRNVTHLGPIDPSNESDVLAEGTCIECPFWLAENLQSSVAVTLDLPQMYKPVYRDILKADPNVVNLHKLGKYFFEFGKMVCSTQGRGGQELSETLIQAFIERQSDVCSKALLNLEPNATERLDCLERDLVSRSKESNALLDDWLLSGSSNIKMAQLVNHHRKRKIIENSIPI